MTQEERLVAASAPSAGGAEPIRVVHLIERMAVGGMEKHIEYLLQKLPADKFQQWLCCMNEPGPRAEEIRAQGYPVAVLGVKYYYVPWHFWKAWRYLRRLRPHVVHAHGEFAAIFGRAAAVAARVPVVVFQAQNVPPYIQAFRHVLQNRLLTACTAGIIACSQDTKRYLVDVERIPPEKIEVIHNCVDVDAIDAAKPLREEARREFGFGPEHVVLGTVSRLAPVKGHAFLLDALARLHPRHPHARLLIVCDGPERPNLEAQVERLGLDSVVQFAGMRGDAPRLLAGMDVFVQPTADVEGLPLAIAEAMAAGLPVAATDVGGVREAVVDGENGFLIPPRDAEALASALDRLIVDAALRRAMGERGRRICEQEFSADLMAQRTAALYRKQLSRKGLSFDN